MENALPPLGTTPNAPTATTGDSLPPEPLAKKKHKRHAKRSIRPHLGGGGVCYEDKHPKKVRKIMEAKLRGEAVAKIAREHEIHQSTVNAIIKRSAAEYDELKKEMAGVFLKHAQLGMQHAEEVLPEAGYLQTMTGVGIAIDKVAKLELKDEPVVTDNLQMATANAITAKIQAETIKILMEAGAFNPKPKPIEIDVTPNDQP